MSHSDRPLMQSFPTLSSGTFRGPYFIMGKNHAARETTRVLTVYLCGSFNKTKDLHNCL